MLPTFCFLYVFPPCPLCVLLCVFTASLGCHPLCSPLLLRELPEGGGAVKAVVMLGLFNKDRLATASQTTCDSYNLFLIILYMLACLCSRTPTHTSPRVVFEAPNLAIYFPPCVCVCVCAASHQLLSRKSLSKKFLSVQRYWLEQKVLSNKIN